MSESVLDIKRFNEVFEALLVLLGISARRVQGQENILVSRQMGDKLVRLKYEADGLSSVLGKLVAP